jgi:hypothetical protein
MKIYAFPSDTTKPERDVHIAVKQNGHRVRVLLVDKSGDEILSGIIGDFEVNDDGKLIFNRMGACNPDYVAHEERGYSRVIVVK